MVGLAHGAAYGDALGVELGDLEAEVRGPPRLHEALEEPLLGFLDGEARCATAPT
jgi:hypothetical protein